jgi:hypothetical protein
MRLRESRAKPEIFASPPALLAAFSPFWPFCAGRMMKSAFFRILGVLGLAFQSI